MKKMVLMGGVFVILLAACGQKGPLYLPQPAKPSPDASAPAKTESKSASQLNSARY
ncbi:LPS translocon maturation chaperone LptM [Cellvibrio sp.]|uniref:LPS translocon maturation chaperone LptM n=1 Tax=Cellvibrio sp. TaxID=1965322 RepID=UPI0039647E44